MLRKALLGARFNERFQAKLWVVGKPNGGNMFADEGMTYVGPGFAPVGANAVMCKPSAVVSVIFNHMKTENMKNVETQIQD